MNNKESLIDAEISVCLEQINELEAVQKFIKDHEYGYVWGDRGHEIVIVLKRRFYSQIKVLKITNPYEADPWKHFKFNMVSITNEKEIGEMTREIMRKTFDENGSDIRSVIAATNYIKSYYIRFIDVLTE